MVQNDMDVLIYKILRYLYECMKSGQTPELEAFSWESKLMSIPREYWMEIIAILVDKGYIEGFRIMRNRTKDVGLYIETNPPYKITYEGVGFLNSNSRMEKAKSFCGQAFIAALSSLVGNIVS